MKDGIDYYRHFTDSDQHAKFKMLRCEFGWEGEGKFWALNNRIGKSKNCWLDLSKKYTKAAVANDLDFNIKEFERFLEFLIKECELLIEFGGKISTKMIQENYREVSVKREKARARKMGKNPGSPEPIKSSPEPLESSSEPNNKGKESKVKESKEHTKASAPEGKSEFRERVKEYRYDVGMWQGQCKFTFKKFFPDWIDDDGPESKHSRALGDLIARLIGTKLEKNLIPVEEMITSFTLLLENLPKYWLDKISTIRDVRLNYNAIRKDIKNPKKQSNPNDFKYEPPVIPINRTA